MEAFLFEPPPLVMTGDQMVTQQVGDDQASFCRLP